MLDHVAIKVSDRSAFAHELTERLGLRVIEQTERFTLMGVGADFGKITLLDALEGAPPTPQRIVSLVFASGEGEAMPPVVFGDSVVATFVASDELGPDWERTPRHALIGLSLRASDPPAAATRLQELHGMQVDASSRDVAVLGVGPGASDGRLTLSREAWDHSEPQVLDHIGIRVADAALWRTRAEAAGVEVVRWVEAEHSKAVFLAGPDGLLLEFVELTAPLPGA